MTTHTTRSASARQRRISEQTAHVEAARRVQLRRRALWAGTGALVLVLVIAAVVLLVPRPTAAQGHQVPTEGNRQHVDQGTDVLYRNRPPSSGNHYPTPAGYGVFTRDIAGGNLVHTLEHGGIIVYYRPDLCDQACVGQLQLAYSSAPKSQRYGVVKMTWRHGWTWTRPSRLRLGVGSTEWTSRTFSGSWPFIASTLTAGPKTLCRLRQSCCERCGTLLRQMSEGVLGVVTI